MKKMIESDKGYNDQHGRWVFYTSTSEDRREMDSNWSTLSFIMHKVL